MKLKDIILILINLAILGTIIAIAVYIFQIGNGTRTIKCAAVESFGNSDISSAVTLGDGSRVKAYRSRGDSSQFDKLPIFKFGDLAKRALDYKTANPGEDVYLDFAIYQLQCGLWIGVDPDSDNYTAVKWDNCAGAAPISGADKLIYTLVLAAQAGVNVRLLYQNPTEGGVWNAWGDVGNSDGLGGFYTYLLQDHDFLKTYGKTGKGTLLVRRPFWKDAYDPGQMHNKFMTVSHYKGDEGDPNYLDNTYSSTGNCKDSDRVQSSILVNGNKGLYNSYRKYFDLMWENSVDIEDLEYDEIPLFSTTDQITLEVRNDGDSTRKNAVTLLSTTEYYDNFVAAVRACHDSESNCSCNCTISTPYRQIQDGGKGCSDIPQSAFNNKECNLYYQKDAVDSRGGAKDDAWCTEGEATCTTDSENTTPIPTEPWTSCIYSSCCGTSDCENDCTDFCQKCIGNENACKMDSDCCSKSCVNGYCANNPGGPSGLNYVGEFISAYFYPMSEDACTHSGVDDAWSEDQNAIVSAANLMALGPMNCEWTNICYKWNTGSDQFSATLLDKLGKAEDSGVCTLKSAIEYDCCDPGIWSVFPGSIRKESEDDPYIHAKDFAIHSGGMDFDPMSEIDDYSVITGSTNIKIYGVCSKGNNQLKVKDKTIYDFFIKTADIAGA